MPQKVASTAIGPVCGLTINRCPFEVLPGLPPAPHATAVVAPGCAASACGRRVASSCLPSDDGLAGPVNVRFGLVRQASTRRGRLRIAATQSGRVYRPRNRMRHHLELGALFARSPQSFPRRDRCRPTPRFRTWRHGRSRSPRSRRRIPSTSGCRRRRNRSSRVPRSSRSNEPDVARPAGTRGDRRPSPAAKLDREI